MPDSASKWRYRPIRKATYVNAGEYFAIRELFDSLTVSHTVSRCANYFAIREVSCVLFAIRELFDSRTVSRTIRDSRAVDFGNDSIRKLFANFATFIKSNRIVDDFLSARGPPGTAEVPDHLTLR